MTNYLRHGDLSFKKINELPKGIKTIKKNCKEFVLALGETTGHRHLMLADRPETKINIYEAEGKQYLEIIGGQATVQHEEHKTITFEPGIYIKENEREFDYFQEEITMVQD
jgi:hypothetical protein